MRSPAALLASEMVSALRELSLEGRLEALALATEQTILAADHGDGALSLLASFTERLTGVVRKGMGGGQVARRSSHISLLDQLKAWMSDDDPTPQKGRLRAVVKDNEGFGAILILSWITEGKPTQYASQFFADGGKQAWDTLNREVLEPVGFGTIPYSKLAAGRARLAREGLSPRARKSSTKRLGPS